METRKPEFVLYGIASASDRYFVTGYRLIPAKFLSELYVKNIAAWFKATMPNTKYVYLVYNSEEIREDYDNLFAKNRDHFQDRVIFKSEVERLSIRSYTF